jgi:4-amino-4-deoxy-L-arabinose transferase-like glycosyltransferase
MILVAGSEEDVSTTSAEAPTMDPTTSAPSQRFSELPPLSRLVYLFAAIKFVVTIAFAGQYGFHRDELYYLASGQHPSLGYVDYPPVTPMLARLDTVVFGTGLVSLRLLPILAGVGIVTLAGMIARELGGGAAAQALAAFCVVVSGIYLGGDWLFQTVAFDQLMWAVTLFLLARLLRTHDRRLWIAIGVSLGIGLETKYTIVGLGLGVAVGLLATRERRQLLTPWPWLALAIAAVLLAPNLVWQAQHGWASLSYLDTHHGHIAHDTSRIAFVLEQLLFVNIFLLPLVIVGIRGLLRNPSFKLLAWIPIVVELVFLAAGGKSYYATPMFVLLYAAGAVALEPYLSLGRSRLRWATMIAPATVLTLALLPIALPVLPAGVMAKKQHL